MSSLRQIYGTSEQAALCTAYVRKHIALVADSALVIVGKAQDTDVFTFYRADSRHVNPRASIEGRYGRLSSIRWQGTGAEFLKLHGIKAKVKK